MALLGPAAGGASAADECPNEHVRQQQGSSWLPECRAFEMVSPPDKNGNAVLGGYGVRPGGGGFAFWSPGAFAGAQSSVGVVYLAERTAVGWRTTAMNPPMEGPNPNLIDEVRLMGIADDLSSVLVSTQYPVDPNDQGGGSTDLYRVGTDGSVTWASHGVSLPSLSTADVTFGGANADLSGVVFHSARALTPDAPNPPPPAPVPQQVYEWSNGEIHLLSRAANGDPMAAGAAVGQGGLGTSVPFGRFPNAVSEDASRVVFMSPPSNTAGQVYVRIARTTTVRASASQRTVPDPNPPRTSVFRDATPDTSKVLFSSPDSLTDDAVRGTAVTFDHTLYLYDVESGELANVSPYDNPSAPPEEQAAGPKVRSAIGLADDGSDVYFIATGRLVDGPGPVDGQRNVYHYDGETDTVEFIGLVASNEADSPEEAEVSADGERMLLRSTLPFDGGTQTGMQLYLYDAASGDVTCVSCTGHGNGLGDVGSLFNGVEYAGSWPQRDYLSVDGQRVFFTTMNSLVPHDVNGTADVYEWANGRLHLLSSGRHPAPSVYVGKSADDSEVFILTNESLTGHDVDNGVADAYAVKVNGGFPEPPLRVECTTDCRLPVGSPPAVAPGSESFSGAEAEPLPPRPGFSVRRPSRPQQAKLASGGKVTLRVRVNRAGRVALTARARLGGRRRLVASDAARARRAGTVQLDLRLRKAARSHLARGNRLRVTVSVRFARVREPRRMTLNLKGGRR